ncbi:hypothetical protein B0H17DRAFT_1179007 [Mycena rosella]|uniref:2'-5' RNA ligase family protein n=1 Tax=Mycena rosella TaxID=1033263 RepID=A0AAD7GLF8_MYCRO|nr:hypothetical protein B0H17DRAFT_1179007 [Mycena rosella]
MVADRLEIDFAPDNNCPLFRGYRKTYRLEETISEYSDYPPHITLMLSAFHDPHGDLLQVLGDICAQWDPFAFDLSLQYEKKAGVWAAVRNGRNNMHALRDDLMADLRYTKASRGEWRPHVTLYRRALGGRSSLKVKQEIARELNTYFEGPLVGYATGASLWLGDELVENFPFLVQTEVSGSFAETMFRAVTRH